MTAINANITDLVRAKTYANGIVNSMIELLECVHIEGHDHSLFEVAIDRDLDMVRKFVDHAVS